MMNSPRYCFLLSQNRLQNNNPLQTQRLRNCLNITKIRDYPLIATSKTINYYNSLKKRVLPFHNSFFFKLSYHETVLCPTI